MCLQIAHQQLQILSGNTSAENPGIFACGHWRKLGSRM
jgi:hypothetical protein